MARKSPASSTSSTVVEEGDGGDGVGVVAGAVIGDDAGSREEGWRAAVSFAWRFAHRKGESKEGGIDILLFSLLRPWERNV